MEEFAALKLYCCLILSLLSIGSSYAAILLEHQQCYDLIDNEEYQAAYDLAKAILDRDISNDQISESYFIMAWSARNQNLFSEAIKLYDKAIYFAVNDDDKAKLMKNLGAVFHYINQFEGAIRMYEQAAKLSEKWAATNYYNMAVSQVALRDYVAAGRSLDEGIRSCERTSNEYYKAKLWNEYGIIERDMYEISGEAGHAHSPCAKSP